MKVLITISYYLPNISGLTIYARHLAEELSKRGHRVVVLTAKQSGELANEEKINSVKVKRAWTPLILARGPIMPFYPITSFFEVMRSDVINCHIPQFEAVFPAFWAKMLGKKVYLTHHCDLTVWPGLLNKIAVGVTYLSLLITGLLADKIIVYTKDYADSSRFLQIYKNKLLYQLPPVKLDEETNKVNNIGNEKFRIGFAGRIAKEKGLDILIKTIPDIKNKLDDNFRIYLAGPYKEVIGGGKEEELEKLVNEHKQHVVLLGALNSRQINYFYQNMDVVVLPSTQNIESFGFVQVEAMLSGTPVVASDMPGVRMPVNLTEMGKITPVADSERLAKNIVYVLKNKKRLEGRKKATRKIFEFKKSIDFYERLFKTS